VKPSVSRLLPPAVQAILSPQLSREKGKIEASVPAPANMTERTGFTPFVETIGMVQKW
jgi:hypothetical protein